MAQLDFQINVGGNAGEAIGSLKKQLREATAEVAILSDKFGSTSQEAINAAKRAAELKDRIGDAKALTDAFNPDAKFKALTSSLSGVAGGFAAVQGAIGLFGTESKNVEKALLKVQSAMALSQGLQAIGESVDSFKQLKAVVIDVGSKAFGSLRAAIISTGIGALVVALGLLIANFDAVKKYVLNLIPGLGKVADFIGNLVNKVTDFIGITSEAGRATAKLIKDNEKAIKDGERFLDLNADKYDEYTQRKIKANLEFKKKQNEFLNDEALSEAEKIKFVKEAREKANREILASDADRNAKQAEANRKAFEEQQKLAKERKDAEEAEAKRLEEGRAKARQAGFEFDMLTLERREKEKEQAAKDAEEKAIKDEEYLAAQFELEEKSQEIRLQATDNIILESKKRSEAELAAFIAKKDIQNAEIDLLANLGGILQQVAGKNKALQTAAVIAENAAGIGRIIVNTQVANAKAVAASPLSGGQPWVTINTISGALGVAASLLAAKKAISEIGGGGSVGSAPSTGSGGGTAPLQPQAPQAQLTQLNPASINALGNQAIKAYVVETDVTTNQQRIKAIQQRARFD